MPLDPREFRALFSKYELVRVRTFDWSVIWRDLVIGSNERSRHVDVHFDNFGQNGPPKDGQIWPKCPKTAIFRNMILYGQELLNGRS